MVSLLAYSTSELVVMSLGTLYLLRFMLGVLWISTLNRQECRALKTFAQVKWVPFRPQLLNQMREQWNHL